MIQVIQSDINNSLLVRKRNNGTLDIYPLIEFCTGQLTSVKDIATAATDTLVWLEQQNMLVHNAQFEVRIKNKAMTSITTYCSAYLTQAMIDVLMEDSNVCPLKDSDEWTLSITPLD